jgi:hypothetical protein
METHHKRKEEQWDRNNVDLCEMKQNSMAWRRKWGRWTYNKMNKSIW